jgi:hypothetical protein
MVLTLVQEIETYDDNVEIADAERAASPPPIPEPAPFRNQQGTSYQFGGGGAPSLRSVFYEDYKMKKESKNVHPEGYQDRDVPMSDELQKIVDEEILQGFDEEYSEDNAVNYSADGGVVSYQNRNLEEAALARFIRSVLQEEDSYGKDYLSKTRPGGKGEERNPRLDFNEDDHDRTLDHEDVDEASVAADAGGGPATPLGTGPDGRADSGPAARKRAIDAAEKSFGGASQLNESRWAKLAGIK